MTISRYYAMYAEDEYEDFCCSACGFKRPSGWMVFDRKRLAPQGDVEPIALCVSRTHAFRVRDALNGRSEE